MTAEAWRPGRQHCACTILSQWGVGGRGGGSDCLGVEDGDGGERDGNDGVLGQGLHASERRHVERQCEPLKSYSSAARVSSAEL